MSRFKGFTLIELLLVVTLIGILSGLVISVINPTKQRNRAEDGVIRANLEEAIQGVEAYKAAEGTYPIDSDGDSNPIEKTDPLDPLTTYITSWPNDDPTGVYYKYYLEPDGSAYGIVAALQSESKFFKFRSDWSPPRILVCDVGEPERVEC